MIIRDKHMIYKSLEAICNAKDCTYYRILPTGDLYINHSFKSYVFLAYVHGNWFTSFGTRKSASMAIPEDGFDLFACGNNSLWIQNNKTDVDISTPIIPLDESTRVILFAFSGKAYNIVIADGSKYSTVISTCLKKTPENTAFLVMTLTSLIRQYDEKAADDILQFWFNKKDHRISKKGNRAQIQFKNQEETEQMKQIDTDQENQNAELKEGDTTKW